MGYEFKASDVFDFAIAINAETKQKGDELFFKYCPYCHGNGRDKESFSVNLSDGVFKCFRSSCGKQGHFVELARDFDFKLDFGEAVKKYRRLPQKKPTPTDKAIEYMASRGISAETVKRYRLTTLANNSNVIAFPFYDENDLLVAVKYRKTNFDKMKDRNKEWFEKNTMPILFGMAQCTDFERLIITEGQIDSLSVADCGLKNAVSVPNGAMGFTWLSLCWDWISKFKEVVVFGDNENGKMTLIDTLQKRLPQKVKAVRIEDYLGEKDANDIYRKYGKQAIERCVINAESQKLRNVKKLSEVKRVNLDELPKIKTNIRDIDRLIGGLVFGQVVLLSGKRGHGKSTFMSQLVCEAIDQDCNTLVYSGELADYHFKRWLDYQLAGKNNIHTQINEYGDEVYCISDDTLNAINSWYDGKAYIYDNNYLPENENEYESLLETVENAIKQYDVKMICVDNLMTAMDTVTEQNNLYLAQSNFVGGLKKIAIKHNVVIVLVAHPRKNNGAFTNDDVSGSGDITNKVDVVINYQRCDDGDGYNSKVMITKNRLGGKYAIGDNAIKLAYSDKTKRIAPIYADTRKYGWESNAENLLEIGDLPF